MLHNHESNGLLPEDAPASVRLLFSQAFAYMSVDNESVDLGKADRLLTPLSLGWGLLAFRAWGEPLGHAESSVSRCFERQASYGPYDTQQLSLLLVSLLAKPGLLSPTA